MNLHGECDSGEKRSKIGHPHLNAAISVGKMAFKKNVRRMQQIVLSAQSKKRILHFGKP